MTPLKEVFAEFIFQIACVDLMCEFFLWPGIINIHMLLQTPINSTSCEARLCEASMLYQFNVTFEDGISR